MAMGERQGDGSGFVPMDVQMAKLQQVNGLLLPTEPGQPAAPALSGSKKTH